MATIISQPKTKGYRTKCKNCQCVFEFSYQETARGQGTGRKLTVCPVCRKIVYYNFFTWKKVKF